MNLRFLAPREFARLLLLVAAGFCLSEVSFAQNIQHTSASSDFTKRSQLTVDPSTLGLNIQIPLGNYPGRAGNDIAVVLYYSSKVHRINFVRGPQEHENFRTYAEPIYSERMAAGWTSSLAVPTIGNESTETYDEIGNAVPCTGPVCWYVRHVQIIMPDGSSHDLRHGIPIVSQVAGQPPFSYSGLYYAVDGSQLLYDWDSRKLFLPDGSHYILAFNPSFDNTIFKDRNGNIKTYNPARETNLFRNRFNGFRTENRLKRFAPDPC